MQTQIEFVVQLLYQYTVICAWQIIIKYDVKRIHRRRLSSQNLLTSIGTLPQNKSDPYSLSCGASNVGQYCSYKCSLSRSCECIAFVPFLNFTVAVLDSRSICAGEQMKIEPSFQ